MKITINIPNPYKVWKEKRGVKLTMSEAKRITGMLESFRNSEAGEYFTFGTESIKRMEDVIDAQLFDGRVYHKGSLGLWVDKAFTPQEFRHGKWVNS